MKIQSQQEVVFTPVTITITLESQAEVNALAAFTGGINYCEIHAAVERSEVEADDTIGECINGYIWRAVKPYARK